MIAWKSVRLTSKQFALIHAYGQREWQTRSPSEALRLILYDYFSERDVHFPDEDIQWGGRRYRSRKPPSTR